ncbi:arylmalonate decarboxylase [uncultured Nitratireductor sp.]|uniref:maleate cis-trans isomerase family protein n=1 Tax=uncultured Nitratireductor sp. TaxID=520953 RepID=UPI0025D26254|nr:arylmalonate decarboxylase [uncultured Nitratireductor sp.]
MSIQLEKPSLQDRKREVLQPPRFDAGRNARAKIGFVLLPNDQLVEEDMVRMAPPGVGVYFSRARMPHEISTGSLAQLTQSIAETAGRILPDDTLDVVCLACTSGTVAVGEARVREELNRGAPNANATSLMGCVTKALEALKVRRLAVGTPYAQELTDNVVGYLHQTGFDITSYAGLGLDYDREMVRVTPDYLLEFAAGLDTPEADALLISCSALRSIEIVEELEQRIGKPVVVSNQAMMWNCLRLAGIEDSISGYGALLRRL